MTRAPSHSVPAKSAQYFGILIIPKAALGLKQKTLKATNPDVVYNRFSLFKVYLNGCVLEMVRTW